MAASPDGRFLAVAIENERDEDLNDGVIPQMPAGYLAILELDADGRPTNCDSARLVDLTGLALVAPGDPEPEFLDVNDDNIVAVTLQENNHIALVDLATGDVAGHFPAGSVDLDAIDTEDDGIIQGTGSLTAVPREPDAVAWLDTERLVTANEGDYEGGSRGFTIFSTSGDVLYDSGNQLEHLGMAYGHYPEARAGKKGVEPEGAEVGLYGDTPLLFIGTERGNFVAVFEDKPGAEPAFVQLLPTAVGPEGILAIPARDLFVAASEVDSEEDGLRGSLGIYARTADVPPYPTIVSATDPATGAPIGWGALSGLAADPGDPNTLYGVSDSAYAVSRIYTIDVSEAPARITSYVDLAKDGAQAAYDLEGIAVRPDGGFWLASEGNPDKDDPLQQRSLLLAVAADGAVEREIPLPDAAYEQAIRFGFEGVATRGEGADEQVVVAVQRAWKDDPKDSAKLALYSPAQDSWSFVRYPLEAPKSERGGWVGLSEITYLDGDRFALIERDNQPGDHARLRGDQDHHRDLAGGRDPGRVRRGAAASREAGRDRPPARDAGKPWLDLGQAGGLCDHRRRPGVRGHRQRWRRRCQRRDPAHAAGRQGLAVLERLATARRGPPSGFGREGGYSAISRKATTMAAALAGSLMLPGSRTSRRLALGTTSASRVSNSARSASGSWNGWPGASISETPPSGRKKRTGPSIRLSLAAIQLPMRMFSSTVVRIRVTCGLCTYRLRSR